MRHFGRPDLSMHGVATDRLEAETAVLNALIVRLARGQQLADGALTLPDAHDATVRVTRSGGPDDDDFNNAHYELVPAAR
jgi:hypothetical protein